MDSSDGSAPKKFSSEDRIRQLNEIDKDITELVNSAGSAIQALTNSKLADNSTTGNSLNERKAAFKASTSQYFQLLSSIDVRLRRQVYALEEAGILESEISTTTAAASFKGDSGIGLSTTGSGTFNPLEISWLNSRKDTVGKTKEAESWAAARDFLGSARGNAPDTEAMDTHT